MNIKMFDLQSLKCFVALMAERNVTRAAEQMDLSQPAVSHILARMRRTFDDPLLIKAGREMVPTRRALELQEPIQRVLRDIELLVSKQMPFRPGISDIKFVLTATEYVEHIVGPRLMSRLKKEAPGIRVEFRSPMRPQSLAWLEKGEIDFRLGWPIHPNMALHSRPLFRDRFVCVARVNHPDISRGWLSIDEYFRLQHVQARFVPQSTSGRVMDDAIALHRRKLHVALTAQNFLSALYTVATTDLIATVPERAARPFLEHLQLQILNSPLVLPELRIGVYWHQRANKEAPHRWFRQLLSEVAKEI